MRKISTLLMFFVLLVWGSQINGQINISVGNSISENFNIGTDAVSTMPTNWKVDKNNAVRTLGSYTAALSATEKSGGNSMANNASNGIYNFAAGDPATEVDRAIGGLSSSSTSKSVNVYTQLKNNGLTEIADFTISYNVEKYRNGSNAAGFSIQMYYSTDGTTWTSAGSDFLSSFAADADNEGYAVAPGSVVNITSKTLSVPVSAEGFLYLAWNYSVTSGTTSSNAQALGIDDVSITANSAVPLEDFDVTYSVVGTNGTLTAAVDAAPITSPASVQEGKDVIFTAAPAVGYQVKEWKLNSVLVAGNTSNTYTLSNIDADADVSVEFEEISTTTFAVSFAVVNGNGDLTATVNNLAITSPEDVLEGNDVVFTAVPNVGYQVKEWKLNNVLVAGNTSTNYTLTDVSAISNVSVEFEMLPTYTITFTVKNASDVDITNAVITFDGVANPEGDYIFDNVAAGTYDYSVVAPTYQTTLVNGFVVTEASTIPVVLQNQAIASLPINYSGPWQNGLPTGWSQTGLGGDYANAAAKFDGTDDQMMVQFGEEPGVLTYSIKGNTSGTEWDGTFDITESADGLTWTSVANYSGLGDIDHTIYSTFTHNLLSTTRFVKWVYTEKVTGNVGIDDVIITLPLQSFDVTFDVIGTNGTLTASVDAVDITSPASVQEGKDVVFTATPVVGYQVKEWKLNSVLVAGNTSNTFTISNLDADADVSVEFEEISTTTFAITFAVVNGNGDLTATVNNVAITSPEDVLEGNDVVFTAAPAVGFQVKEWKLNDVLIAGNTSTNYTLTDVSAISNVSVEFEAIPTYTVTFEVRDLASTTPITNAIINFNSVENSAGNYIFTTISAGSYSYTVAASGYETLNSTSIQINQDTIITVLLQAELIANLPIDYSGPWLNGLPAGWTQSGLGSDYASGAAKFDSSDDYIKVRFDQEPGLLIYSIKGNTSGSVSWDGTFEIMESVDGSTWTSVESYSGIGEIDHTAYTSFTHNLLPTTRIVKWVYTEKITGNVGLENVIITLPLQDFDVTFDVVGAHGTLSATVDAAPITSPASVQEGKDVVFTAVPAVDYQVKEWKLNSVVVAGNTSNTYTLSNLSADADVSVEFEEIPEPITYVVDFSVIGTNGTLIAKVDGVEISTGDFVEEGNDVVFTATPATSYRVKEWTLNSTIVPANTSNEYTATNIMAETNVNVEFELDGTGVSENNNILLNIYPNPSNGLFTIVSDGLYTMEVLDIQGRLMVRRSLENGLNVLDMTSYTNGIYVIRVNNANQVYTTRISKSK